MTDLPPELAGLPPPSLIEVIGFEARYADLRTKLVSIFQAAGIDYAVTDIETDPAQILLQVSAYQDVLLRQRVNEAIRSWFLSYATGGDLDVLAQWYDVTRLLGESDVALKRRIILAIQGRSTGGTEARYRSIALGADSRVSDVAIYTVGRDPTIHVALFSTDSDGIASPALIQKVDAALQGPNVRMVNDRIVVASAARAVVPISAKIWLLPGASVTVVAAAETALRKAWLEQMGLGRNVTLSWVTAQLQVDGVYRVEVTYPASDVAVEPDRAAALGVIALQSMGWAH